MAELQLLAPRPAIQRVRNAPGVNVHLEVRCRTHDMIPETGEGGWVYPRGVVAIVVHTQNQNCEDEGNGESEADESTSEIVSE